MINQLPASPVVKTELPESRPGDNLRGRDLDPGVISRLGLDVGRVQLHEVELAVDADQKGRHFGHVASQEGRGVNGSAAYVINWSMY